MGQDIIILLLLIMGSAFFSSAETSLTTFSRAKLKALAEKGVKSAAILEKLLEKPGRLLATILVGNTLTNIGFTVFATTIFLVWFKKLGLDLLASSTFIIACILTIVILVFGEFIPKMLALSKSERVALAFAFPISVLQKILAPLVIILNGFSKFLVKMVGGKAFERGTIVTEEELKTMIEIGAEEGILEKDEKQMLSGVFELGETAVREIMTPRGDMVCINIASTLTETITLVSNEGHSRIPVYEDRSENIIGIIYAKDLIKAAHLGQTNIRSLLRPVQFVPASKKIDVLLKKMRTKRSHLAIVIDEHGGVAGLITIEDILEEIVGEITDEYDDIESPSLRSINDKVHYVEAGMNVFDLNQKLDLKIPEEENYDTIGGFVAHVLGEIPKMGEKITYENLLFEVTQLEKHRILQLKLTINES